MKTLALGFIICGMVAILIIAVRQPPVPPTDICTKSHHETQLTSYIPTYDSKGNISSMMPVFTDENVCDESHPITTAELAAWKKFHNVK
jgi:hypothetical protein